MIIRPATKADAEGIAAALQALVRSGKRSRPSDEQFVLSHYIEHPDRVECHIALDQDGSVLGFQSLRMAVADNEYGTPTGWAMIGTHIRPSVARRGIGTALFDATRKTAQASGIPAIEAFIGDTNAEGQAYYGAMGFRNYRKAEGAVCKRFTVG